jgi:hypothetical protein
MYPRSLSMAAILLCLVLAPGHAKAQAGQTAAEPARQQPAAQQLQSSPAFASDKAEPKENKKDSALSAIAHVAPIVTATVAVLFGLLAWRFNERSIRRMARQDHIRMLVDIDKIYVERPTLWRIYDNEFPGMPESSPADPWEPARRRGLIYLYLNMFDAAYDFDRHLNWRNLNRRTQSDREYLDSWKIYIKEFFERSTEAAEVMRCSRDIYSKGFVQFIEEARKPTAERDEAEAKATGAATGGGI